MSQKKHKNDAERQAAYRERLREKRELNAEQASEEATIKSLNLAGYSEIAPGVPARTWLEEVQIHRSWLRGLEAGDVKPGETLRQLAKRTWETLLASEGYGVITDGGGRWTETENGKIWVDGCGVWYPLFDLNRQTFQIPFDSKRFPEGPFGEGIRDAAQPGHFEKYWVAPEDCTGDEVIDTTKLLELPPMRNR